MTQSVDILFTGGLQDFWTAAYAAINDFSRRPNPGEPSPNPFPCAQGEGLVTAGMRGKERGPRLRRKALLRGTFVKTTVATATFIAAHSRGFAQTETRPGTPATQGGEAMPQAGDATPSATTHDMTIIRLFDAPVARVWQAWRDPEDVKRWWGPKAFTAPVAEMDFREGGTSLVGMRSPEGQVLYNTWTYRTIEPMELIEFIQHFADANGNPIAPEDVGLPPEIPREVRHVITFKAVGDDRTEMTVTEYGYTEEWVVEMSKAGMNEVLDKMAAVVAED